MSAADPRSLVMNPSKAPEGGGLGLARLVFEKLSGFHESAGPWEGGKIGFAIGERVFWTDSYSFPGDNTASHAEKVAFAQEIVLRLNAPDAALSKSRASGAEVEHG